jgi:hypothetical protein
MVEAEELEKKLAALAVKWRKRLADPALKAQVEAGTVVVDPLVLELLKLFPE